MLGLIGAGVSAGSVAVGLTATDYGFMVSAVDLAQVAASTLAIEPNDLFMPEVSSWADTSDTILVMCRSGGRAALAINALAQAGYTRVFNILEGIEGERVNNPQSVYHRKRMVNGWKSSGLPWTHDLDPDQMRLPTRP